MTCGCDRAGDLSPPKQPEQRSIVAATATCGSSAGAKAMNQGWLMPWSSVRSRRCRSCRRTASPPTVSPARGGALVGDVGHHLGQLARRLGLITVACAWGFSSR